DRENVLKSRKWECAGDAWGRFPICRKRRPMLLSMKTSGRIELGDAFSRLEICPTSLRRKKKAQDRSWACGHPFTLLVLFLLGGRFRLDGAGDVLAVLRVIGDGDALADLNRIQATERDFGGRLALLRLAGADDFGVLGDIEILAVHGDGVLFAITAFDLA